jgi:flagellar motor switch protein FliM
MENEMNKKVDPNFNIYDFDRPDKFSLDSLKTLETIGEIFARNFATNFSAFLRLPIDMQLASIEQVPFATEYTDKMPRDKYIFCVSNLGAKDSKIIAEFELGMAISVMRKLLGGSIGTIQEVQKSLTELEKIGMKHWITNHMLPSLKDGFRTFVETEFEIENLETDPQYAKITLPTDMIAIITFNVIMGTEKSRVRLVFPYMSLEHLIDRLSASNADNIIDIEGSEEFEEYLRSHVKKIEQELVIELGKTQVTIKELLEMKENHFILLDYYHKPLIGYVGEKPKFKCKPGKVENKKGVTIIGTIYEEEKTMNENEKKEWFSQEFINDFLSKRGEVEEEKEATPISLEELGMGVDTRNANKRDLELLYDIPLDVRVVFGRAIKPVDEILQLEDGSIVKLDRLAGEPVDILIGDYMVAKGEIMIYDDKFGVRIIDILPPQEMLQSIKEDLED